MRGFTAVTGSRIDPGSRQSGASMVEWIIIVAVIVVALLVGVPAAINGISGEKTGRGWFLHIKRVIEQP